MTKKVILIGMGEAAKEIYQEISKKCPNWDIVGFVDDSPQQNQNTHKQNLPPLKYLGKSNDLQKILEENTCDILLIAIEYAPRLLIHQVIKAFSPKKNILMIIPARGETLKGNTRLENLRKVRAEDLIGRRILYANTKTIEKTLKNKTILITGAGGSIGSELCKQILSYPVKKILTLSRGENSLFFLKEKIDRENPQEDRIVYLIGDILDENRLNEIGDTYKIDFVFHAAAHKHVPLMETHPKEAFKNNVLGTQNLLHLCRRQKIKHFVFISTDKAVNPTTVMGASKRIAELLTRSYHKKGSFHTSVVRFGNVISSRGSVVPLFRRQIRHKMPITITHPQCKRFFMTITEAAMLVVETTAFSINEIQKDIGQTYMLDMGKAISIKNLVQMMLKLHGHIPHETIPLHYIGLRPGEKLNEELWSKEDFPTKTENPNIYAISEPEVILDLIEEKIQKLNENLKNLSPQEIKNNLLQLASSFRKK